MAIAEREITPTSPEDDESEKCLQRQVAFLNATQLDHGLWTASLKLETVDPELQNLEGVYCQYVWPRDCVHVIRALLLTGEMEAAGRGLEGLLRVVENQEAKLGEVIANPALAYGEDGHYHRFMPRYSKETLTPITRVNGDNWNNFQNDVPGAILWLFGKAENLGFGFLKTEKNRRLLKQLGEYCRAIKFWEDKDAGPWEEDPHGLRSSSLAAVTAGLLAISPFFPLVNRDKRLRSRGVRSLARILPNETDTREYDSALLYTIDPFGMVDKMMARTILERIEGNLVKENGCVRYLGDKYKRSWQGNHAEWPLFLFKLAIGWKLVGEEEKAQDYLRKGLSQQIQGLFSESFGDGKPVNYPLMWTSAAAIEAIVIVEGKRRRESCFSALVPQLR